jgi:hypothetical protein
MIMNDSAKVVDSFCKHVISLGSTGASSFFGRIIAKHIHPYAIRNCLQYISADGRCDLVSILSLFRTRLGRSSIFLAYCFQCGRLRIWRTYVLASVVVHWLRRCSLLSHSLGSAQYVSVMFVVSTVRYLGIEGIRLPVSRAHAYHTMSSTKISSSLNNIQRPWRHSRCRFIPHVSHSRSKCGVLGTTTAW